MDSKIKIVSINEKDINELKELFSNSGHYVSARGLSDYWLYARLFNNTCFVAKDNENIIASVIAFCDQSKNYKEIYIQDFAVLPYYQGKVIGSLLMDSFIKSVKTLKVGYLWLTSESDNEKACKLWTKFGFVNNKADYMENGLWVTKDLKGQGKDRVIYSLEL
jgi:ribosomal protein S18 acetylase RimI-like enzyme